MNTEPTGLFSSVCLSPLKEVMLSQPELHADRHSDCCLSCRSSVCKACNYHIWALRHIRRVLPPDIAKTLASSIVSSRLDYCNGVLYGTPNSTSSSTPSTTHQNGIWRSCFLFSCTGHLEQSTNLSHRSEQSLCFSSPTQDTSVYCSFWSQWLTVMQLVPLYLYVMCGFMVLYKFDFNFNF